MWSKSDFPFFTLEKELETETAMYVWFKWKTSRPAHVPESKQS